jgi:hypothetical protein
MSERSSYSFVAPAVRPNDLLLEDQHEKDERQRYRGPIPIANAG